MVSAEQKWPDCLWIVRHGESSSNVARRHAYENGLPRIVTPERDVDVPLSPLGEQQARALGRWFGGLAPERRPTAVRASCYVRAMRTAGLICEEAGLDLDDMDFIRDERLREQEFGIIDRLTRDGIDRHHPEQAELRAKFGKFYHRPPGGESWCDVILRLRSVIDTLTRDYRGERVLIVCHSVVVSCFRYLLERMTEQEILDIDRQDEVANCSVTRYEFDPSAGKRGKLVLREYNFVAPLVEEGASITSEPDARAPGP